jgi:hypothetical protein
MHTTTTTWELVPAGTIIAFFCYGSNLCALSLVTAVGSLPMRSYFIWLSGEKQLIGNPFLAYLSMQSIPSFFDSEFVWSAIHSLLHFRITAQVIFFGTRMNPTFMHRVWYFSCLVRTFVTEI